MSLPSSLLNALERYLAGEASPEEEQLVNDWYHSFDDREVEVPEEVVELRNKVGGRLWRRLTATIDGTEHRRGFSIGFRRGLVAAASVCILLLAGEWLLLSRQRSEKIRLAVRKSINNDVAPGGDRAMLTLADGTRIALDSAHKGMLTLQGNTRIVKLDDGKLAYDASPSAGAREPASYNTITTPRGGQFQVTLPDGTAVWLNAATSLRYPTHFGGQERRVSLTGEAYFEVIKSSGKPFIVDMPDQKPGRDTLHIQVLGTNFNANNYEDEVTAKTTLLEGAVKIIQGLNAQVLLPGQQAQTGNGSGFRIIKEADIEEALAWKNGLFQYNSTDLQAIMRQVARWYDVRIVYEGQVKDEFFSGSVPRTENVSQLLHLLAMTNTVHFKIDGREIHVIEGRDILHTEPGAAQKDKPAGVEKNK